MSILNHYGLRILVVMIFLLPAWLIYFRGLFINIGWRGVGGWEVLLVVLYVLPVLIGLLLTDYLVLRSRNKALRRQGVGSKESLILWTVYVSVFLFGIFLPISTDVPSPGSLASIYFGLDSTVSFFISVGLLLLGALSVLLSTIFFIVLHVRKKVA